MWQQSEAAASSWRLSSDGSNKWVVSQSIVIVIVITNASAVVTIVAILAVSLLPKLELFCCMQVGTIGLATVTRCCNVIADTIIRTTSKGCL